MEFRYSNGRFFILRGFLPDGARLGGRVPAREAVRAERSSARVQSVERAFELLEQMAAAGGRLTIGELAAITGLPMPTIHRLMRTLVMSGHVRQEPSRRYALGPRLIVLGESASALLSSWARPHLAALVDAIGETANMALMEGDEAVYVAQVPSRHAMRMFTEVGRRVFPHCTGVGKVLLAQLPPAKAREILERTGMPARTPHTITDPGELLRELEEIRRRGYALDDGEQEVGVRCVAVPVLNAPALAALSISGPQTRLSPKLVDQAVPLMQKTAHELAAELASGEITE